MSGPAALDRLLSGTGLVATRSSGGILIIGSAEADSAAQSVPYSPEIVVTGSLIPRTDMALPIPTTTLSAADITARGFTSVADAIQRSPFSIGSVTGSDIGYTQGAKTTNLFGMGPQFTKYLIDGRPLGIFPALYNNSTTIVDLSSLPTALIESVEILPGGQSSIYGSDAISGVVNVRLKKKVDAPTFDVRHSFDQHGGDSAWRFSGAGSFSVGAVHVMVGGQYETKTPLWAFQRALTATNYAEGSSPALPNPIAGVYSSYSYQSLSVPTTVCSGLSSLYGGTVAYYQRSATQSYCGTDNVGYSTISNDEHRLTGFVHATVELGDNSHFYSDVMIAHAINKFAYAQSYGYYYSAYGGSPVYVSGYSVPIFLVRYFSPEEAGGIDKLLSREENNTQYISSGIAGRIGQSHWTYDINYVHNHQTLNDQRRVGVTSAMNSYFTSLLGNPKGTFSDLYYGTVPSYSSLGNFFSVIPQSEMSQLFHTAVTNSSSNSNWARALLSNGRLMHLPGGDAGIALAVEGGNESWHYVPDAGFQDNSYYYNLTDVSGDGTRYNLAVVGELRAPLFKFMTLSASARYDRFFVDSVKTGRFSYDLGAELNPFRFLTLRARYGTAFKAPTLPDLFQGESGALYGGYDYLSCAKQGISNTNCYNYTYFTNKLSGNTALKPITAKVWDLGIVFHPGSRLSFATDVLHWDIRNEVAQTGVDAILRGEALCASGSTPVTLTCSEIASWVTRDSSGNLVSVYTPNINIARQITSALVMSASWRVPTGKFGDFSLSSAYTLLLESKVQGTPSSAIYDALANPANTTFRSRINASLGWQFKKFSATVYVDRLGQSANYAATVYGTGNGAGKLPAQVIANLGLSYDINDRFKIAGNIDNLFDVGPPVDHTQPGYTNAPYDSANYNVIGRAFSLQASYKF